MIVYALKEGTVIWSHHDDSHKAGRVPQYTALTVIKEVGSHYRIDRPDNITLPPDPDYPNYYVKIGDTLADVPVAPIDPVLPDPIEEGEVTDEGMAVAIITILKWMRQ